MKSTGQKRRGFTMIEIMIVIAIIGIVIALAVPAWLRARETARGLVCQENLTKIDGAKEQWSLENNKGAGSNVGWDDLVGPELYIKTKPSCPTGNEYTINVIGSDVSCPYVLPDWMNDQYEHNMDGVRNVGS